MKVATELSATRADVRWIDAASMHLTLKFLGHVDARDVGAVDAAVSRVAGAARPTRGRLCDLGSFPHLRRPRVLFAGVQPQDEALASLHEALQSELESIGFPRDARRFHPHVTLGRVRSNRRLAELVAAFEERRHFDAGIFSIDALTLFESELRRSGALHHALGIYRLADKG